MPKPCKRVQCAGEGHFEGDQCPGSDDETHHCTDCGALAWDDKGNSCDLCGAYWCIDWQFTFVFPNCENIELSDEGICSKCFLANPEFWCNDAKCLCDNKQDKIQERYVKFKEHGSLCGEVRLVKNEQHFCIHVYRYNGENKARVKEESERFFYGPEAFRDATEHALALKEVKLADEWKLEVPTEYWDTNPSGVLSQPSCK